MTTSGDALGPVAHRGVVDERLLAVGQVDRVRPLLARRRARCAAGCCANVPRIITSWWPRRAPYELNSSGATPCSWSHWPAGDQAAIEPAGEMWSVVTESPSTASTRAPSMSRDRRGRRPTARRRTAAWRCRSSRVPGVSVARRDRQRPPALVALEDDRVGAPEQLRVDRRSDDRPDLVERRPDVGEDTPAGRREPLPERLGRQVDVDPAGQGERDDERRRGEVARPGEGMDPALEVAVARQDGGDDEVVAPRSPAAIGSSSGPELPMQVVQP